MIILLLPHAPPPPSARSSSLLPPSRSYQVSLIISLRFVFLFSLPPLSTPFAVHGGASSIPTLFRPSSLSTLSPPIMIPPSNSPPSIPSLLIGPSLLRLYPPPISAVSAFATRPSSPVTYPSSPFQSPATSSCLPQPLPIYSRPSHILSYSIHDPRLGLSVLHSQPHAAGAQRESHAPPWLSRVGLVRTTPRPSLAPSRNGCSGKLILLIENVKIQSGVGKRCDL